MKKTPPQEPVTTNTSKVWTIEIPDCHPSINSWMRMHFIARNKLNNYWKDMVWALAKEAKLPQFDKPVEIFIHYYHPRDDVDLDNYTPKFIIDGLKTFFGDDDINHVKKLGWTFHKEKVKRSVVEIREFSE